MASPKEMSKIKGLISLKALAKKTILASIKL